MNKKTCFYAVVFAVLAALVAPSSAQSQAGASEAIAKERQADFLERVVEDQVAASLPKDLCIMRIAVMPLMGDKDSAIGNAIIAVLKKHSCTVLERDKIGTVLEEQHIPADLVDEGSAVKAGKLLQAEIVIYGSVERYFHMPGIYFLKSQLRIANTQTAEILWTKAVSARELSRAVKPVALVLAILLLIWILFLLRGSIAYDDLTEEIAREKELRHSMAVEVDKSKTTVSEVQNNLTKNDHIELASSAKDLGLYLDDLGRMLDNSPYGVRSRMTLDEAKGANKINKAVLGALEDLTKTVSKLRDKTAGDGTVFLAGALRESISAVQDLKNRLKDKSKFFKPV